MQSINETIANRYRLRHRLGAGSYAETFLADDTALDRRVAVKILRPEFTKTQEELARFRREAQIAASLQHRNVVPVYDAGAWNGTHYLVMEWVNGTTLKRAIRSQRRLGFESAINIVDDLLAGLAAIHEAGIIHRDIKPHNILLTEDGTAKLTDFGVALTKYSLGDGTHAETYGTAAYMAPEQALGGNTGPQSDLYAVGVILYEMLTGRLPFIADDPFEVIHQHIHYPIPRPKRINPNIPSGLEAVLLRSLAKQPHERYASAEEMRDALRAAYEEARAKAASPAGPRPVNRHGRARLPWIRLGSATALVALMLAVIAGSASLATRDLNENASSDTTNGQLAELPDMLLNRLDPGNALSMRREGESQPPENVPSGDLVPTVTPEEESEPQNIPAPSHTGPPGGVADASNQPENSDAAVEDAPEATEPEVAPQQDSHAQQPTEPQEPAEQSTEEPEATQEPQDEQHTGQGGTPAGEPDENAVDEANKNEGDDEPSPPAPEQNDGDENGQQPPDVANNEQGPPENAGNGQGPSENPGNGEGSPQNQEQGDYSGTSGGPDEQQDAENDPEAAKVADSQGQGNGQANGDDDGSDDNGNAKQQGSNSAETTKVEQKKSDKERKKKSNGDSSDSAGNNDREGSDGANDDSKEERKTSDKGNRNDRDDDDDDRESEDREESSTWVSSEWSERSWNDDIEAALAFAVDLNSNRDDADERDRHNDSSTDEEQRDESHNRRSDDRDDEEDGDRDNADLDNIDELFGAKNNDDRDDTHEARRDSNTEGKAFSNLEKIFGSS